MSGGGSCKAEVWVGVNYGDLIPGNGVATTSGMFNKSAEAEE